MNRTTLLALVASLATASPALAQDIKFEGRGAYREKMDAMQGGKFDPAMWKSLNAWMGTAPLTAESTKDKVVCIVTWASWNNGSAKALQEAQKVHSAHGSKGHIVVGMHDRNGWDGAAQVIGANKVNFIVAHDESGAFFKKLGADSHPDIFVIDRAGKFRYADIMTDSLDAAVQKLLAETPEQAAAAASTPTPEETAKAPTKRGGKFVAPPASAYAAANWPAKNTGRLTASDMQGKPLPGGGLGQEKYLTPKPSMDGKLTVIDFWATWCPPCVAAMPELDSIQKDFKDDVVVLGLSSEAEAKVAAFIKGKRHEYSQAIDVNGRLSNAMGVKAIPHIAVVSSDGVVRWQGSPSGPGLRASIKSLLEADPGVKARRESEKKR